MRETVVVVGLGEVGKPLFEILKQRHETFGVDIGQDSRLTVEEYERFLGWLQLTLEQHVHDLVSARECV